MSCSGLGGSGASGRQAAGAGAGVEYRVVGGRYVPGGHGCDHCRMGITHVFHVLFVFVRPVVVDARGFLRILRDISAVKLVGAAGFLVVLLCHRCDTLTGTGDSIANYLSLKQVR